MARRPKRRTAPDNALDRLLWPEPPGPEEHARPRNAYPERDLVCYLIKDALLHAIGPLTCTRTIADRKIATDWLLGPDEEPGAEGTLSWWCSFIDIDGDALRQALKRQWTQLTTASSPQTARSMFNGRKNQHTHHRPPGLTRSPVRKPREVRRTSRSHVRRAERGQASPNDLEKRDAPTQSDNADETRQAA